jgi:hypothetical protein
VNGNGNREQRSGLPDYLKRAVILRVKGLAADDGSCTIRPNGSFGQNIPPKHFILKESVIAAPHQTLERRQLSSSAVAAGGTEYVEIR